MTHTVEKWSVFEVELQGTQAGNPFIDVDISATFSCGETIINTAGFYDGDGVYKIRCMPTVIGDWTYTTHSNQAELDGQTGTFSCVAPSDGNHGPVYVHNQFHFAYADGSPYNSFGTTCYAWVHQGDELEELTLKTLSEKPFNKLRMCVFPKHYPFNRNDPVYYPFERDADGNNDLTRFDPSFFHHFEQRLEQLLALGIEADIIIWHPYDRWGYSEMDEETDYRYLRYIIARFAAYRHIWWSLANEYDFLLNVKPVERWDNFFKILQNEDPYQHLRSIHNGDPDANFDHTKPEITHVSIQNWDVKRILEWRATYGKPIVNDELEYEGNIPYVWGNITAEEEVHRFWIMTVSGGYAGHGETYMQDDDLLWWGKGGELVGESWKGIAFLREIVDGAPAGGLTPIADVPDNGLFPSRFTNWYWTRISGGTNDGYFLIYLGEHQIANFYLWSKDDQYDVDILDTKAMTITPTEIKAFDPETMEQHTYDMMEQPTYYLELPTQPYLALRIKRK